jgi:hypothetical protein
MKAQKTERLGDLIAVVVAEAARCSGSAASVAPRRAGGDMNLHWSDLPAGLGNTEVSIDMREAIPMTSPRDWLDFAHVLRSGGTAMQSDSSREGIERRFSAVIRRSRGVGS